MAVIKCLAFISFGIGAPMAFLELLSVHYSMARVPTRTPAHVWMAIAFSWIFLHVFIIGFALWGVGFLWQGTVPSSRKALLVRIGVGACVLMIAYSLLVYAIVSW